MCVYTLQRGEGDYHSTERNIRTKKTLIANLQRSAVHIPANDVEVRPCKATSL